MPSFREALRFWFILGWISFGGPAGQIAIMHREVVERRGWIEEPRFLHALNFCMVLPGPEACQLAIYLGWLLHGTLGGLVAGVLFVLPSVAVLWSLSWLYATSAEITWVAAMFYGLKAAVLAIVAHALIRIGRRALGSSGAVALAVLAFIALYALQVPFPWVILGAGLAGLATALGRGAAGQEVRAPASPRPGSPPAPGWRRSLLVLTLGLLLWWTPVAGLAWWLGSDHLLVQEGIFFSKAAMVTFGGAYAVLPYVAQQAVERFGWLSGPQMISGLGLAETTPGPLIMVVQFVAFLAGWNQPGPLSPLGMATAGALLTTWVTFVPCFLWIFLGAPYVERLYGNRVLKRVLTAITAAVVGVIASLTVWFGRQVLVPGGTVDWFAVVVGALVLVGLVRWRWNVVPVVLGSAAAGLLYQLLPV